MQKASTAYKLDYNEPNSTSTTASSIIDELEPPNSASSNFSYLSSQSAGYSSLFASGIANLEQHSPRSKITKKNEKNRGFFNIIDNTNSVTPSNDINKTTSKSNLVSNLKSNETKSESSSLPSYPTSLSPSSSTTCKSSKSSPFSFNRSRSNDSNSSQSTSTSINENKGFFSPLGSKAARLLGVEIPKLNSSWVEKNGRLEEEKEERFEFADEQRLSEGIIRERTKYGYGYDYGRKVTDRKKGGGGSISRNINDAFVKPRSALVPMRTLPEGSSNPNPIQPLPLSVSPKRLRDSTDSVLEISLAPLTTSTYQKDYNSYNSRKEVLPSIDPGTFAKEENFHFREELLSVDERTEMIEINNEESKEKNSRLLSKFSDSTSSSATRSTTSNTSNKLVLDGRKKIAFVGRESRGERVMELKSKFSDSTLSSTARSATSQRHVVDEWSEIAGIGKNSRKGGGMLVLKSKFSNSTLSSTARSASPALSAVKASRKTPTSSPNNSENATIRFSPNSDSPDLKSSPLSVSRSASPNLDYEVIRTKSNRRERVVITPIVSELKLPPSNLTRSATNISTASSLTKKANRNQALDALEGRGVRGLGNEYYTIARKEYLGGSRREDYDTKESEAIERLADFGKKQGLNLKVLPVDEELEVLQVSFLDYYSDDDADEDIESVQDDSPMDRSPSFSPCASIFNVDQAESHPFSFPNLTALPTSSSSDSGISSQEEDLLPTTPNLYDSYEHNGYDYNEKEVDLVTAENLEFELHPYAASIKSISGYRANLPALRS